MKFLCYTNISLCECKVVSMFDWQKKEKENTDVEPDKVVEQQHKADQMYENLRRSSDGDNFKVEEEKSVMGQRRRFNITDKNGAQTDVDITENAQIEVRGEQKEVRDAIERGEKISNVNPVQNGMSGIQQNLIAQINSSNLSEEEKQQLRENIEKHNFADTQKSTEQYTQDVQATINAKENAKVGSEAATKVSMANKVMELRGLGKNVGSIRKSSEGRTNMNVSQMLATANVSAPRSY